MCSRDSERRVICRSPSLSSAGRWSTRRAETIEPPIERGQTSGIFGELRQVTYRGGDGGSHNVR